VLRLLYGPKESNVKKKLRKLGLVKTCNIHIILMLRCLNKGMLCMHKRNNERGNKNRTRNFSWNFCYKTSVMNYKHDASYLDGHSDILEMYIILTEFRTEWNKTQKTELTQRIAVRKFSRNHLLMTSIQSITDSTQWRAEGRRGFSPPPPKFRRPSKIVPNAIRLWELLKIAEFRTTTPQDVRQKGSKILKLPRFAIGLH